MTAAVTRRLGMPPAVLRVLTLAGGLLGAFAVGQLMSLIFSGNHTILPLSVQLFALATGCSSALFAVGLVLVYRASRVINFAHPGFGGVAAVLFLILTQELGVPYFAAMLAALVAAVLLGGLVEILLVRRFFKAPRLVLTVVTIGVVQGLQYLAFSLPKIFGADPAVLARPLADTPLSGIKLHLFPVIFTGDLLLLVVVSVAAATGLALFFRFSNFGIAVRGAAENDDRAQLLGINVRTLSTLVWIAAALLSGLAYVLALPVVGFGAASVGVGSPLLLRALAASVFARMENLPTAVVAALAISVFEQSTRFATGRTDVVDVAVFVVILVGLLLQRKKLARADVGEAGTWAATEEIRPVPPELAPLPSVRKATRWVAIGAAVLLLGYPWVASPSQTNLGALFAIYGIVAISLVILTGWGGQISLGQWGFAAVGALVGGAMTARYHQPFPVALLLGSLSGAGVAVLLGLPALRIRGLFLAVTTLAFSVVASTVLLNKRYFGWLLPGVVNRPKFGFINTENERAYYYLCLIGLAFALFVAAGLRRSRTGRVLIAMRDNERAAQSFGVNLVRTRLITFAISGFLAAFAGVLFAHHQHAVDQLAFAPDESVQMFLMAVIGGLGSIVGVLLGPLYLGLTTVLSSSLRPLASGLGVVVVLLVIPGGFGALAFSLRDAFLRRVAIRNRIFVPSLLADYSPDGEMAKVPLQANLDVDGNPADPEAHYRLDSRIGVAGTSQLGRRWSA